CFFENREYPAKLTTHIDVSPGRADCVACEDHSFYQEVGNMFQKKSVLESSRFTFVGVADQVDGFPRLPVEERPLKPRRESRASPATKSRVLHLFRDRRSEEHTSELQSRETLVC